MKQLSIFSLIFVMFFFGCKTQINENKLPTYKGLPLIKAKSDQANYRIGNDWFKGRWTISPQIEFDTLHITSHSDVDTFAFHTDLDSVTFKLLSGEVYKFYVSLNDTAYALTVVNFLKPNIKTLEFDTASKNTSLKFLYEQNNNNEYLDLLRSKYSIDSLIKGSKTDTERALKILNWVHNQWQHNGSNTPRKSDAISILEEVKEGKNFRCVEYGIVASACLNAIGLKTRTLGLMTKDVETTQYGAGHVLSEVYLNDIKKWVVIDGQWDAMPFLNGIPLNAVEFQKAITNNFKELEIRSLSGQSKNGYINWIYPYLYYFDISFDNREGVYTNTNKIDGKSRLMLVPIGATNPTVFQIKSKIDYCLYTNSLNDFYAPPSNRDK